MSRPFLPGEPVTILPPYDEDPIVVSMQRYAHVVEDTGDGLIAVVLTDVCPPTERFLFPPSRLAPGWKDANGRWR